MSSLPRPLLAAPLALCAGLLCSGCAGGGLLAPSATDALVRHETITPEEFPQSPDESAPRAGSALAENTSSEAADADAIGEEIAGTEPTSDSVIRYQDGANYEETEDSGLWDVSKVTELTPTKIWDGFRQQTPWRRNENTARDLYRAGQELFEQANYDEAADKFKDAAFYWPDSPMEEDALFMQGECQFFGDKYPKANDSYAELLKKYTNSRHIDKIVNRQFAIARYWQELQRARPKASLSPNMTDGSRPFFDTSGNALATYEAVRLNDPTGPLADDSVMATANAYFVKDRYTDADYYYGLLRSEYPQSEHAVQAYLLGLRSKLRTYQGEQYDGKSLEDSDALIQQMLTQFPQELGAEHDRLLQVYREVRAQRALRDWQMCEYYNKNSYYGAARYFCEKIIKEYPDTPYAGLAQERLEAIKDLPAEPPKRFKWLVEMFPGEDE